MADPIYGHAFVGPVITPGRVLVVAEMLSDLSPLEAQFATAFTFNGAVVKVEPNLTVILVVPWPLTRFIFAGKVHVYETALATGAIEYTTWVLVPIYGHALAGPLIVPGVAGKYLVTLNDLGALLPQLASAVTFTLPDIKLLV